MPRNMSFMLTTKQMRIMTKTVTRRNGWWFLDPGDIVNAVEKCRGLKKGEKVKRIGQIEITATWPEILNTITPEEIIREGFKGMSRKDFVNMYCRCNKCKPYHVVNRIGFIHL